MDDTENPGPAVVQRRLRAELRRARLNAGLMQEQVAQALDWSLAKLIRIETGAVNISASDLRTLLQHYAVTDVQRVADLLSLSQASRERSWWSTHREISRPLARLIEYENAALVSRHYQDLVIPGLLQVTDYMRASTRQLSPGMAESRVDEVIEVRLRRQELLTRRDAPQLYFVVDEAVIRRVVGGNDVMRRQLQHLVEAADRPNVTIEVVPFTAGLVPGLQAPFVIHEFSEAADDELLYLESPHGDVLTRDRAEQIVTYREDFERLRQASLGPQGTVSFLRAVIAELG